VQAHVYAREFVAGKSLKYLLSASYLSPLESCPHIAAEFQTEPEEFHKFVNSR
jgi:hypothetical protein